MVTVEFTRDFRGTLTNENFYRAGEQAMFPADVAEDLERVFAVKIVGANKIVPAPPTAVSPKDDYSSMSLSKLREIAKKQGIRGYGRMKRNTLIQKLEG